MIYSRLESCASQFPDRIFVIDDETAYTFQEVLKKVHKLIDQMRETKQKKWLLRLPDSAELLFFLFALDATASEAVILSYSREKREVESIRQRFQEFSLITDALTDSPKKEIIFYPQQKDFEDGAGKRQNILQEEGVVVILTSGTTGVPKETRYFWRELMQRMSVKPGQEDSRWLLAYHLNHFAGIQVFLHTLLNAATLVIPKSKSFEHCLRAVSEQGVDHISATPTFWRMFTGMLQESDLKKIHLRHITLGGESVTGDLLKKLLTFFPDTPISQIYATTELGVCFTVRDNQKGFPVSYLQVNNLPVQLKIEEDELHVLSPKSGEWTPTGDLVRIEGDRVLFLGRKEETINIGGRKVHPHEIEEMIAGIPGVQAVRVYGVKNAVTGQLVAADIKMLPGFDKQKIEGEIQALAGEKLERYKQPRILSFVNELPMANQKIKRS
jgi:acyl-CoA synthetase (AMP-forming)/AMP-acid ligase II